VCLVLGHTFLHMFLALLKCNNTVALEDIPWCEMCALRLWISSVHKGSIEASAPIHTHTYIHTHAHTHAHCCTYTSTSTHVELSLHYSCTQMLAGGTSMAAAEAALVSAAPSDSVAAALRHFQTLFGCSSLAGVVPTMNKVQERSMRWQGFLGS